MYIPSYYQLHDFNVICRLLQENAFGILFCENKVSHIPFNIHVDGEKILLEGHVAVNNPVIESDGNDCVCTFQGPHAYISTTLYEKALSVPTWDYLAVNCYGKLEFLPVEENIRIVEDLMRQTEIQALEKWVPLPEKYKNGLQMGIRAFKIEVERFEGISKLSQNRTPAEINNIIRHLSQSENSLERELAEWIRIFNTKS